jgi:carbonic anhydrase
MNSSANLAKTPQQAWDAMLAGNQRFVTGTLAHPRQDIDHREVLAAAQLPFAALFGCSDSRLSAEIIFDVGLGDLFVVRNAGQVIAKSILGSLEYAVEVLQVPLIIVLGHDDCGAIKATIDSVAGKLLPQGEFIQHIVENIEPTVRAAKANGVQDIDEITALHVHDTINDLVSRSKVVREALESGKLAVVGANYKLVLGDIHPLVMLGQVTQ